MSPAADAADRLVDDPVARGARTAPATPTSRLLTSPAPQREKDKKENTKRKNTKRKWRPVRQVPLQSAGGALLARAELPRGGWLTSRAPIATTHAAIGVLRTPTP